MIDRKGEDASGRLPAARMLPFHYGWVVVGTGTLTVLACLGFGRFALGMLLPAMGDSLGLSYSQMGFISTGNFVGYLAAVVASGWLARRWGERAVIAGGAGLVAGSLLGVAGAQQFWHALILYVLTGMGSGAANVPIMGLVSHWFRRSHRGRAAGFIVIGSGFAIMLSGWMIPRINTAFGPDGWRISWLVLGSATLAVALSAGALLRNRPHQLGLEALGRSPEGVPSQPGSRGEADAGRIVALLGLLYFFFGFTYVIYATFIVTTLVEERGFTEAVAGRFWMWVGAFSLLSGPVFGSLSDRLGRRVGLRLVFGFQMASYLLMAFSLPPAFIYLSVFLYGVVAWSIPSIMAAAVGDYLGPERAAVAFGTVTLFFGVGQIIGPGLAGVLADVGGGFTTSYLLAAAVVGLAIGVTWLLPGAER